MKKFMEFIAAVKTVASFAFAALVMLATVMTIFFGKDSIPVGYIWQFAFLSFIYGCLQLLAFSENYFKKMNTSSRILILGFSMFVALAAFAFMFTWFPVYNIINWILFIGVYAVVFVIALFTLRTVFKLSGIRYNQMLAAYKASHNNE